MMQCIVNFLKKHSQLRFNGNIQSERGTKKNLLYYWGNDLTVDNKYMCNTWTSGYPETIDFQDGFKYTSPISYFPSNSLVLFLTWLVMFGNGVIIED